MAEWNGYSFLSALQVAVGMGSDPATPGPLMARHLGAAVRGAYSTWRSIAGGAADAEEFLQIVYASVHGGRPSVGVHYAKADGMTVSLGHERWYADDIDAVVCDQRRPDART